MSERQGISASEIGAAILFVLPELLGHWLPNGEYRGEAYIAFNPLREDRHLGSFQINMRTGHWADHAIGQSGRDPISLFAYLRTDGDYGQAFRALASHPVVRGAIACGQLYPAAKTAKPASAEFKVAAAKRIYAAARPLQGTIAAAYLIGRGLLQTDAWDDLRSANLRYPESGRHPALIAPIKSPEGALVGIHRTFLRAPALKLSVQSPKLTLGRVRGCAIRFGEPADELIICEGLEDALSIRLQIDGIAVWTAGGAAFLPLMQIPPRVRILTVAADNDRSGEIGAQRAAEAHSIGGRIVRIMRPASRFKDFNDQLCGVRHAQ